MNPPTVSILIVNWNTREILRDCLRTVYEQTKNVAFEVIVVDNASTDGSVDMIRTAFPQALLLANYANRGFAAANNQGIEVAKGRYVLLLNSDTLVLDGAIDKMVTFRRGASGGRGHCLPGVEPPTGRGSPRAFCSLRR